MKKGKFDLQRFCLGAGVFLILLSVAALVLWQTSTHRNAEKAAEYVDTLHALIPGPQSAVIEPRLDNAMASLNIDGQDFTAIIEIPVCGAVLPVGSSWDTTNKYPCRYDGSIYDSSLIIGTSNLKGQFDFVKELSVGDFVYVTDMTGNRYSYNVSDIRYTDHAGNDLLYTGNDLTIFVKNHYAFEYIMIHCNATGT